MNKINQPTKGTKIAKVPVIMQMEAVECGAACLTMVLAYYGKWVPLEKVREDCGVSRDGSNAYNVLQAGINYGLDAGGVKLTAEELQDETTFPCIIFWEFNHFVVLKGVKNGKYYLNDPGQGPRVVNLEDFKKSYTGICLTFEPTDKFKPSGKQKSMFTYAREQLKGATAALFFMLFATILGSVFSLITPVFSRIFIDYLLPGKAPNWFWPFIIALFALGVVQCVVAAFQGIYSYRINGKMAVYGSSNYFWHVLRLPMRFFSQRIPSDIVERKDTSETIAQSIVQILIPTIINIGMMLFYLVVMIRYSWVLTLIGISANIINIFVSNYITGKKINIQRKLVHDNAQLSMMSVSGIEMVETIKASGAENNFFTRWSDIQADVNDKQIEVLKSVGVLEIIPSLLNSIASILVIVVGVYLTFNNQFTIGMIMTFQGFLSGFTTPITSLIDAKSTLEQMRVEMERQEDVLNYQTDVDFTKETRLPKDAEKLKGNVELKDINFGYSPLMDPIVKNINIKLKKGKSIAFVGGSGSGKSTIAKLVANLYDPWSGEILFDGKPIKDIDRRIFKSSIAVVDQSIDLFDASIKDNITLWDKTITDEDVVNACKDAQIHNLIISREGGYSYHVREGGKTFSGGERQRLEIARTLAQNPSIVILDEATSALDAKTEYEVVKAIERRNITCIIIAHRLSTIRSCDEIVVLNKGEIVERGRHEELIKQGGLYSSLITSE